MHFTFKFTPHRKQGERSKCSHTSYRICVTLLRSFHNTDWGRKSPRFSLWPPRPLPATALYLCSPVRHLLFGNLCSLGTGLPPLLRLLLPPSSSRGCCLLPKCGRPHGLVSLPSYPLSLDGFRKTQGFKYHVYMISSKMQHTCSC